MVCPFLKLPQPGGYVRTFRRTPCGILGESLELTVEEAVKALADGVFAEFGAVHVLCNNAGVMPVGRILDTDMADWRWAHDANVFGMVHGIRALVPRMITQGGAAHVINTVSMAAFAVYGSTKQRRADAAVSAGF
jgi:NADP-dependent 3-hydroxy acid dehydrogenase YdfG